MSLTHSGGVVYRERDGQIEFLLVTARRAPTDWVLPKGHIDPGESAEEAAVREVVEETGVTARITQFLDVSEQTVRGERQRVAMFLMVAESEGPSSEGRTNAWLAPDAAIAQVSFDEPRAMLALARATLARAND